MAETPKAPMERKKHRHAYEVWRDLGYGRSFRKTAETIGSSPVSVCRWAKQFEWEKRIREYGTAMAKRKEDGALLVQSEDPATQKIVDLISEVEALLDTAFEPDLTGKRVSKITIKSADDLIKLVAEYRKILESYYKFIADHRPADNDNKNKKIVNTFNTVMMDTSQEDRIEIMKGLKIDDDASRNQQPQGRAEDADIEQVPERGDED